MAPLLIEELRSATDSRPAPKSAEVPLSLGGAGSRPALAIQEKQFAAYPPEARHLAVRHIELLRKLPVAFVQLLLEQIREYDWRFPAERQDTDQQLSYLASLSDVQRDQLLAGFERLQLPARLRDVGWASSPIEFSEQFSNYLWTSHQIDAFHQASASYLEKFSAAMPAASPHTPRLGIAIIGKGVDQNSYPLFRKLRPYGTHFTQVDPTGGVSILLERLAARATAHPDPFGHWYIDGGAAEPNSAAAVTRVSYGGLEPNRNALLSRIDKAIQGGIAGPQPLLSLLHQLRPEEIGLPEAPQDAVLSRFQLSLLTAGSGTQIFSTTFVQWATREAWRRAQPLTILARFTPRQRQRPMNELLSAEGRNPEIDPAGSLIDADMAAFYMWLEQQRLPGAQDASFLVWFENHDEALVIAPGLPRNTESKTRVNVDWLFRQLG